MAETKKIILIGALILALISIAGNVGLIWLYRNAAVNLEKERQMREYNAKLFLFRNLFTENIILSDKSVDFENRLKMEEAARGLNDSEIFKMWQDFTKSETSEQVNARAKNLLNLLIEKTKY